MTPATPPSPSVNRSSAPPLEKFNAQEVKLVDAAAHLYSLGFNVIPVNEEKEPLGSWNADERLEWAELERRLAKASGIAITGKYLDDENYGVAILDLDNINEAFEILREVFGDEWKARLCGQSWSFCGLTGPRPKGKVRCECKEPGQDCECTNTETGERRKLSELQRGMYVVVRVPRSCLPGGTIRSDAIEVMVSNYEVVYGRHPSGVLYEPVRFENGKWVPVDYVDLGPGETVNCNELKTLIALISEPEQPATANEVAQQPQQPGSMTTAFPEPTKELGEDRFRRIINLAWPIYQLDYGTHWHDHLLFGLACLMRRAGIRYEDARKVAETLINMWIQAKSTKLNELELAEEMKKENKHMEETIDHVYKKVGYDLKKRCWGRKKFEEKLTKAVAQAINQGLVKGITPKDWFNEIYKILGIKKKKHGGLLRRIIEKRLPKTKIDVSQLPEWIWKFEFKLNVCEDWYQDKVKTENGALIGRKVGCSRRVRTVTVEDSQYVLLVELTRRYERKRHPDAGYEIHEKTAFKHLATLPRFMGIVYDPFYKGTGYYVAFKDGRLYSVASVNDLDSFINDLRKPPFSIRSKQALELITEELPEVRMILSPGITDDGFVDPYGVLDLGDYGVDPLLKAYEWIKRYYSETNAKWAWFNIMAIVAKTLTPLIRFHNKTFNDLIIYNVGRGGEGKSTLASDLALPLLGGDDANENFSIVIKGPVKTDAQLRNLLSLNRLPLILDEQTKKALANNVGILLSATVGMGTISVHANRYGLGLSTKFKNMRGIVVFTNVSFAEFLRDIVGEASDYAIIRRFIEIPWDFEPIKHYDLKDLPELRSIYGFMARLWMKYRDEFIKSTDLLELIEKLAMAIKREYPADSRVDEMVQCTLDVVKELREEKRNERLALTDADTLVNRAYEFVANELKGTQLTAVKVLRYILENPQRAGIKLTAPRGNENIDKLRNELSAVITNRLPPPNGGEDPDLTVLRQILTNAHDDGRVLAVLFARSPLIPGVPKEFMGARSGVYSMDGVKRIGYSIPLAKLVRVFLTGEDNEKDIEVAEE